MRAAAAGMDEIIRLNCALREEGQRTLKNTYFYLGWEEGKEAEEELFARRTRSMLSGERRWFPNRWPAGQLKRCGEGRRLRLGDLD